MHLNVRKPKVCVGRTGYWQEKSGSSCAWWKLIPHCYLQSLSMRGRTPQLWRVADDCHCKQRVWTHNAGSRFDIRPSFKYRGFILNKRRSRDRLIFIMEIPMLIRRHRKLPPERYFCEKTNLPITKKPTEFTDLLNSDMIKLMTVMLFDRYGKLTRVALWLHSSRYGGCVQFGTFLEWNGIHWMRYKLRKVIVVGVL